MTAQNIACLALILAPAAIAQPIVCGTRSNAGVNGSDSQNYNVVHDTGYLGQETSALASGGTPGAGGCSASSSVLVTSRYGWASVVGSGSATNCPASSAVTYVSGSGAWTIDRIEVTSTMLPAGTRVPILYRTEMVGSATSVQEAAPSFSLYARAEISTTFGTLYQTLNQPGVAEQINDTATVGSYIYLGTQHSANAGATSAWLVSQGHPQFTATCSVNSRARFNIVSQDPRVTLTACSGHDYGAGACVADVDDGTGSGMPDGGVTIDDLIFYLDLFQAGSVFADVDDGSGTGVRDGGVTIDDLIYYLVRFEAGC